MRRDYTENTFLALVRAGLWADAVSTDIRNPGYTESVDWEKVYQLAEEQAVIGIVLAGIEYSSVKTPQELLLQWIGEVQILEQQNRAMNQFIAELVDKMRQADIYTLLVKGQSVAQCYDRPLWRSCGDIDMFLSDGNYLKAKDFLLPIASKIDPEGVAMKHLGMTINDWVVELHGSLHCRLSSRINRVLDEIQNDTFYGGNVRSWNDNGTQVFLLGKESDVVYVFVHLLSHFYQGGVGLRQICDLCRMLWTFKDSLNKELLIKWLRKMGLMSEWKAFASLAVVYLGMPADAMPLYSEDKHWKKKAERILTFIMSVGNMGHKRNNSYFEKYPYMVRKVCSMGVRCADLIRHARVFPLDSIRFLPNIVYNGVRSALRGE